MYKSSYQELKLTVLHLVGLSRDAVHIYIGMTIFFLSVALWRKGRISLISVVPVLAVAGLLEVLDLYDDYHSLGFMKWSNSLHDIANTIFWPLVIVTLAKLKDVIRSDS